ncbi:MAG: hypothetical protein EBR92_04575, partial [Alphaproteobacteria bacterium]|nr:hypothetical protein [Alphaproteobacteria bacterium]
MPNNLPDWATCPLVKRIFAAARACGGEARIVGGAVRDWLVGAPVHDIDMAVNLPIGDVAAHLVAEGIKTVETGIAFGTVTAVELVTLGQRRGLGLPGGGPVRYVVDVERGPHTSTPKVVVGDADALLTNAERVGQVTWVHGPVTGRVLV